jgi:hypothetical protein
VWVGAAVVAAGALAALFVPRRQRADEANTALEHGVSLNEAAL